MQHVVLHHDFANLFDDGDFFALAELIVRDDKLLQPRIALERAEELVDALVSQEIPAEFQCVQRTVHVRENLLQVLRAIRINATKVKRESFQERIHAQPLGEHRQSFRANQIEVQLQLLQLHVQSVPDCLP